MSQNEILKKIGLTETEIKVYNSLLSFGSTSVGKIVESTGLYRKNIYDALNKLIDKGLVTYIMENKIKSYQSKDPDNLLRFLDEKKERILENKEELKLELPKLKAKFITNPQEVESEMYRGIEGIKTILKECLNYNEILMIGATGDVENRLPYFWPKYNEKRISKKIKWKCLLIYESKEKNITKSKYYEYKILPKIMSGPNVIYVYGDYVANVIWLEKPIAFVIKNKFVAKNYKNYFNYIWDSLT